MSRAWLATLALVASAPAAPPEGASTPPVTAATARSGVVPWTILDRTAGICAWQHYTHVEGIDVATGRTRWSAPGWTEAVGELHNGDVVVTNAGFGGAGQLKVAVLGREDGVERFACEVPLGAQSLGVQWAPDPAGAIGYTYPLEAPSGMVRPPRPPLPPLRLTLTSDACELVTTGPQVGSLDALRPPTGPLTDGEITVRLDRATGPDGQGITALVGERRGRELWRKPLQTPPFIPCALP